jgi:hypothetical protein
MFFRVTGATSPSRNLPVQKYNYSVFQKNQNDIAFEEFIAARTGGKIVVVYQIYRVRFFLPAKIVKT